MPNVALYNIAGEEIGKVKLSEEIFGHEVNEAVLHTVVTAYLANQRQGTQSALTRAEVSGGGIKPWRQKGTGRARQGSTRSPQWRHGGVVFAPKPRSYRQDVNKKVRRLAMLSALSAKVQNGELIVLESLSFEKPRTKDMVAVLDALKVAEKSLLVLPGPDANVELSARNIPSVKTTLCGTLNVYDIVNARRLVITQDAVNKVTEVYSK